MIHNDWHIKVDVHYHNKYNKKDTHPLDKALRKFNKKIKELGLMPEILEKSFFISKSETKRRNKRNGKYRLRKLRASLSNGAIKRNSL